MHDKWNRHWAGNASAPHPQLRHRICSASISPGSWWPHPAPEPASADVADQHRAVGQAGDALQAGPKQSGVAGPVCKARQLPAGARQHGDLPTGGVDEPDAGVAGVGDSQAAAGQHAQRGGTAEERGGGGAVAVAGLPGHPSHHLPRPRVWLKAADGMVGGVGGIHCSRLRRWRG